jgi:hypothetical protein
LQRRGSLYYERTGSLADVADLLGDSRRVAADHYVYWLTEYRVGAFRGMVERQAAHANRVGPTTVPPPFSSSQAAPLQLRVPETKGRNGNTELRRDAGA